MSWLRIVGILLILGSLFCYTQFRSHMATVDTAKSEARRHSDRASTDSGEQQKYDEATAKEAENRTQAKYWFLSGAGLIVGGIALAIVPSFLKRKSAPPAV
jgi:hypothetical protein